MTVIRGVWDDFVSNNLFPGDKKTVVPRGDYLICASNEIISSPGPHLPFIDTLLASDVSKIYGIDPQEGKRVIENLKIAPDQKFKLNSYVKDLVGCMNKYGGGLPDMRRYCDGLLELVSIVNSYDGYRLCSHGENTLVFTTPTIMFRKLDGSHYIVEAGSYQQVPSLDIPNELTKPLFFKHANRMKGMFKNTRCY